MRKGGGGDRGHAGVKNIYTGVRTKLFWHAIYCAKLRSNPGSQSGSQYRRILGRQVPCIMLKYDLTAVITIQSLTHPRT